MSNMSMLQNKDFQTCIADISFHAMMYKHVGEHAVM